MHTCTLQSIYALHLVDSNLLVAYSIYIIKYSKAAKYNIKCTACVVSYYIYYCTSRHTSCQRLHCLYTSFIAHSSVTQLGGNSVHR